MNGRRQFIKLAPALAAPGIATAALGDSQKWADREPHSILGAWNTVVTLPFPPGSFREFAAFAEGGVFHETNSFLHTSSNSNFSPFGLPSAVNGSDGVGVWTRTSSGEFAVRFRKLLFDSAEVNFGDLLVTGSVTIVDGVLQGDWHVRAVDASTGSVLADFGTVSSTGTRLS
jgi:hypothetical protein